MDIEQRKSPEELQALHRRSMNEAKQLEPSVMVTERNWSAVLEMQDRLFRQQMQLDADLKTLLTKQEAQEALTEMQMSAAEFARQAGSLSARYSSSCKELTSTTQKSITMILTDTKKQLTDTVREARKNIRLCAWISITAVILCAALCALGVLWSKAYTGVLVNHRREYLGGKVRPVNETDWLRHENFYPVIIEKAIWQKVQTRLKQQARPAVNNRIKHRYAGLLTCQECGNVFSPMIRYWNGSRRVEYVCRGYHRNGKGYCSAHRIHEEILDRAVWDHAKKLREQYAAELKKVTQLQKQWALRKPVLDAHCLTLQKEIMRLEQEIDELVMEKIQTQQ